MHSVDVIRTRDHGAAWRWGALLAFALLAPVGLPAGGADPKQPSVRRRESRLDPLLSLGFGSLRSSPRSMAPGLCAIQPGEPLHILRRWQSPEGQDWLKVEIRSLSLTAARRGWIPIA